MTRISLDVPSPLLDRLERQSELTRVPRTALILTTITGLVTEFERIDEECGVACPQCGAATEVDRFPDGAFRVCCSCPWRWPEP